jgi:hypothetical protein
VADHKRTRATSCDQLDHVNLLFDEEQFEGSPNSWGTPWSGSGPLHRELTVSLLGDRRHCSAAPAAFAQEGRSCGIANGRSSSNSGHPPADGANLQRQTRQCRLMGCCDHRRNRRYAEKADYCLPFERAPSSTSQHDRSTLSIGKSAFFGLGPRGDKLFRHTAAHRRFLGVAECRRYPPAGALDGITSDHLPNCGPTGASNAFAPPTD